MKNWLYLINNFAHDLFTGLWFGCFALLGYLRHRLSAAEGQELISGAFAADLLKQLYWLGAVSLGGVLLTGLFRFFYRKEWDRMESSPAAKKTLLIGKHIVLLSAFLVGSVLMTLWVY